MFVKKGIKAVLAALLSAALVLLCGCAPPTISLLTDGDSTPQDCVETLFSSLASEDYETADSCISNYSTLGFSQLMDAGVAAELYGYLRASRQYQFVGEAAVNGSKAELVLEVTTLDYRKVETELTERTTERVHQLQMDGVTDINDERIMSEMEAVLSEMMTAAEVYNTTERFTITLEKTDGIWKLICTEDLYSALIGYAV